MVAQRVAWEHEDVVEQRVLDVAEQAGAGHRGRPVLALPAPGLPRRAAGVDHLRHRRDRRMPDVTVVPTEAEEASPPEHAVNLGQRLVEVEPVQARYAA